jgi:hypothetical protein
MVQSVGDRLMCKINCLNYHHGCSVSHVLYVWLFIYQTKCSSAFKHEWTLNFTCQVTRNFKRRLLNCICYIQFLSLYLECHVRLFYQIQGLCSAVRFLVLPTYAVGLMKLSISDHSIYKSWYFVVPPDWLKS